MKKNYRCTAFVYDVSCIIGNYLNDCMETLEKVLLSEPGGRIPEYFQYMKDDTSHNRLHMLTQSVFYHHVLLNNMGDNASHHFYLSTKPFLQLFHSKYSPQSPGYWNMCHLPTEIIYPVIS